MRNNILIQNTLIYTFAQIFNKSIPFLLLPVLTRYLTAADYGIIAVYNTLLQIITIFVGLNLTGALKSNYFIFTKEQNSIYIYNIFILYVISAIIVFFILYNLHEILLQYIFLPIELIYIIVGIALFYSFSELNLSLWRLQQNAKYYVFYEILITCTNIGISLILIILFNYQWEGRIAGNIAATILFGIISIIVLFKRDFIIFKLNIHYMYDALKYGILLLPHSIALWIRMGVDIFLLNYLVGASDVGLYSVGYQFGAIIGILASSFNNAYVPYLFKTLSNINTEKKLKLVKFTYIYFFFVFIFSLLLVTLFYFSIPMFFHNNLSYKFLFCILPNLPRHWISPCT